MQQPLSQSFSLLFHPSSPPYFTTPRIFHYTSCVRRSYTRKTIFLFSGQSKSWFIWKGDSCYSNFFFPLIQWYSDPGLIPLWLLLYVSTSAVNIGLLLCLYCQILEKGALYEVWNLVELKSGRNLRRWFDLEEKAIFSCGVASSPLQRETSLQFEGGKRSLTWDNTTRCCIWCISFLDKLGKNIDFAKREEKVLYFVLEENL